MQHRLTHSRMSHLMAALALTAGLALTPIPALADEQTPDEGAQQEASTDIIQYTEDADGIASAQVATEDVAAEVEPTIIPIEEPSCTEATPVEPNVPVGNEEGTGAATDDTVATDPVSEPTEVQADATTGDAEAEQAPTTSTGEATSPAVADVTTSDETAVEVQIEDASGVGETAESSSSNQATVPGTTPATAAPKTSKHNIATATATVAKSKTASSLKAQTVSNQQSVPEGTYLIESGILAADGNGLAKLVLHAKGGAHDGAEVITWSYNGNANQKWCVSLVDEGWYTIASFANKSLVLTATRDQGKLYLTKRAEGLASQLWAFMLSGKSYGTGYQLVPQGLQASATDATIVSSSQNRALDVRYGKPTRGADVITYTQSDTVKPNQSFILVDPAPKTKAGRTDMEGRYRVHVPNTQNVIEVRRASSANGANAWTYTDSGKTHQDIYLQYEKNGFYSLWVMGTKKVLDVQGSSILPGANVIQWSYTGKDNQQWAVRDNDDGTFSFVNKATGLVLGGASERNGKFGAGTNIIGAQDNGRANNAFELKRLSLLSAGIYKIVRTSDSTALDVSGASIKNGAKVGFYKDNGKMNQRFELVSAGSTDLWRIRTASSGGWLTVNTKAQIVQQGSHATKQGAFNIWRVVWRNGDYQFKNDAGNRVLGTRVAKLKMTKAPISLAQGLFEIDSKAAKIALDNPRNSTSAGSKINVYTDKNGANQRFLVVKYGSGYKLVNLVSNLVLTDSGKGITQTKFTGAASQVWTVGIADGGYIKLINSSNKKALDIAGSGTVSDSKSTALCTSSSSASREARQSWKMVRMPLPVYEQMAQAAIHFAEHRAHGYSRPNRGTGGNETVKLSDGSKIILSKSDVDCSEMVRQCVCAALGSNKIPYMWTGNQHSCMMATGFKLIQFKASKVQRGDILWRVGHTCIALGNGKTSEALGSETHDIHGMRGDQTGKEVDFGTVGTNWTYIYRWTKTDAK